MRDLDTIVHTELVLAYEHLYREAWDAPPNEAQLRSFKCRPAASKKAVLERLRAKIRSRADEAPLLARVEAAIEATEAKPWPSPEPLTELEKMRVELDAIRRQRDRALDSNERLLARLDKATDTIQKIREVLA